jgi:DNA-directed RNA polymerase specialized sigma54-like protein
MLKPALQLRIGQSLSMTPQLQQAIKLLQLSSLELQQEIQQIFETNPMLERDEESVPNDQEAAEKTEDTSSNVPAEQDITGMISTKRRMFTAKRLENRLGMFMKMRAVPATHYKNTFFCK